jgi:hypothetical protein
VPHRADRTQMFKASIANDPVPDSGLGEAALGGGLAGAAVGAVGMGSAAAFGAIGGISGGVPGMVAGAAAGLILGGASGALLGGGLQHILQLSSKWDRMRSARSVELRVGTGRHALAAPFSSCRAPGSRRRPEDRRAGSRARSS